MATFYLIREAEAAPCSDLPKALWTLSQRGQNQANQLISKLAGLRISHIYSNLEKPSIETALPFAQARGIKILVLNELEDQDANIEDISTAPSKSELSKAHNEKLQSIQRRIVQSLQCLILHHENDDGVALIMSARVLALFINAIDPQCRLEDWQSRVFPDMIRIVRGEYQVTWAPMEYPRANLTLVRQDDQANP